MDSVNTGDRVRRATTTTVKIGVFATLVAGFQVQLLRYEYGTIPVRYLMVFIPIVGIFSYLSADDISENLIYLIGTMSLSLVLTTAVLSAPLFLRTTSLAEQNILLGNALASTVIFTGLSGVLFACGIGGGILIRKATGLHLSQRQFIAVAIVFLVLGSFLLGNVALNLTSAVDQREVEAEIETVERTPDALAVRIHVENRLRDRMEIESVTIQFQESTYPVSVSGFPDRTIPAGKEGSFVIETSCEELESEGVNRYSDVAVGGQVLATSFNEYDVRISIEKREIDLPC